jgi:4-aminobutyrate aminotransferase-like enzyme
VTTAALMEDFTSHNMYFNTFGGNEVSAAVGYAVLNVLRDEKLLENALSVGEYVLTGMRRLQQKYPIIGDVRGQGMFFGVEIVSNGEPDAATARKIVNSMRERGILISRIGPHDNILKIRPPMVFTRENADVLLSELDSVLS